MVLGTVSGAMHTLDDVHKEVSNCTKCAEILGATRNRPRSGFPPTGRYDGLVIGTEPGGKGTDRVTPDEYKARFVPDAPGKNTVRLLFRGIEAAGLDWNRFFYTNSVKCAAPPSDAQRCFLNCSAYLEHQIKSLRPTLKVIVVVSRAATHLGLQQATKGEVTSCDYLGIPTLCIRHPQGATSGYLKRVDVAVRKLMVKT